MSIIHIDNQLESLVFKLCCIRQLSFRNSSVIFLRYKVFTLQLKIEINSENTTPVYGKLGSSGNLDKNLACKLVKVLGTFQIFMTLIKLKIKQFFNTNLHYQICPVNQTVSQNYELNGIKVNSYTCS